MQPIDGAEFSQRVLNLISRLDVSETDNGQRQLVTWRAGAGIGDHVALSFAGVVHIWLRHRRRRLRTALPLSFRLLPV